jgi:hypothetical protein
LSNTKKKERRKKIRQKLIENEQYYRGYYRLPDELEKEMSNIKRNVMALEYKLDTEAKKMQRRELSSLRRRYCEEINNNITEKKTRHELARKQNINRYNLPHHTYNLQKRP